MKTRLEILLVRERPLSAAEMRMASRRGFKILQRSGIQIRKNSWRLPPGDFDFVLITSANAIQKKILNLKRTSTHFIAIGPQTRRLLRAAGIASHRILSPSENKAHSKGLAAFIKKRLAGSSARILFPRSSRADPDLLRRLNKMGHKIHTVKSYRTEIRKLPQTLKRKLSLGVEAVLVTSPSQFESLRKTFGLAALRKLKTKWIAIGPVTARALKSAKIQAKIAHGPSLEAMLQKLVSPKN